MHDANSNLGLFLLYDQLVLSCKCHNSQECKEILNLVEFINLNHSETEVCIAFKVPVLILILP
jgi:hypothetical protein